MRYQYIKRKSGSYDPILKWEKPYNGKSEFLGILFTLSFITLILYLAILQIRP